MLEKTTVIGTTDRLLAVEDVGGGVDEVKTGKDGRGELAELDEGTGAGDENICAVEVIGNWRVFVGVEVKGSPDMDSEWAERDGDGDGDDEIAKDEVNIVPDAANQDVNEGETSGLELKAEEGGRLVPTLVLVGLGESEGAGTLEGNQGQRCETAPTECITLDSTGLGSQQHQARPNSSDPHLLLRVALSGATQKAEVIGSRVENRCRTMASRSD